jgi:hypothetical protein
VIEVEYVLGVEGVLQRAEPVELGLAIGLADAALALVAQRVDVGAAGERRDPRRVGPGGGASVVVRVGVGPAGRGDVLEAGPAMIEGAL